jgi:hypothetical protein
MAPDPVMHPPLSPEPLPDSVWLLVCRTGGETGRLWAPEVGSIFTIYAMLQAAATWFDSPARPLTEEVRAYRRRDPALPDWTSSNLECGPWMNDGAKRGPSGEGGGFYCYRFPEDSKLPDEEDP